MKTCHTFSFLALATACALPSTARGGEGAETRSAEVITFVLNGRFDVLARRRLAG